ncbi:hypothetical protein [Thermaurantiacus sp.]
MTARTLPGRDLVDPALSPFASASTLLCCALPALLVTLGSGAAVAGLVSAAPWLVALGRWKAWRLAGSGLPLRLAG